MSKFGFVILATVLELPAPGLEGQASGESATSVDDIALELSNPAGGLRAVVFEVEYSRYRGDLPGAHEQVSYRDVATLDWPIELDNGKRLILSATIPANGDQPYWKPTPDIEWPEYLVRQIPDLDPTVGGFTYSHGHLADIGLNVGYGGVSADGVISLVGLANIAPTSDDISAARGQWLAGPEIALGRMADWGLYGAQLTHLTNVSGEGKQNVGLDTNETTVSLFLAYALGNGWLIESNPVIFFDWEAVDGNRWGLPISVGASKTLLVGQVPVKLAFEVEKFAVAPERFGRDWIISLRLTPALLH